MRLLLIRALVYTHRWLGIVGCLLFIAWFVSGMVLMYAGMPGLSPAERLGRLPPLDVSAVAVPPAIAAERHGVRPQGVRLTMFDGRPVYRFETGRGPAVSFADTGEVLPRLSDDQILAVARRFVQGQATLTSAGLLTSPDQWTLEPRWQRLLPLNRVAVDDGAGTMLYVAPTTGEVVLKTTRTSRALGFAGAVVHWLYFTPIRQHGPFWVNLVIYLSMAGILLCLSGIVWGIWRYSPGGRFRLRRAQSHTPYAGMMRWHHYAGLVFGLTTFTWIFSGLLSMDPWDWHPGNAPTPDQRWAVSGGPLRLDDVTAPALRAAAGLLVDRVGVREAEIVQVRGEAYVMGSVPSASTADAPGPRQMVALAAPERGVFARFDADLMMQAAREAMPDSTVEDAVWLDRYDAYYYSRRGERALPVLRVRFLDSARTWLYLDPAQGAIVLKEERLSRLNRWLYHGLHSLDFPWLYQQRPLWDIVVIVLSLGGLASTITAVAPAWRRLRRHAPSIRTGRSV